MTTAQRSPLTGTLGLLRLDLRRDRIVLPLWVLLLSVPLSTVYVASISGLYPETEQRAGLVASVMASPAQRALYGNIYNDLGGGDRALEGRRIPCPDRRGRDPDRHSGHTRGEEETGRTELLDSCVVGRYAGPSPPHSSWCSAPRYSTGLIGTVACWAPMYRRRVRVGLRRRTGRLRSGLRRGGRGGGAVVRLRAYRPRDLVRRSGRRVRSAGCR